MKNILITALTLLLHGALVPHEAVAADPNAKSPNGFLSPQCTFGVDWICRWNGWDLKFSRSWGRDADVWPSVLTNGYNKFRPGPRDIMVLRASKKHGLPVGHVAVVASSKVDTKYTDGRMILVVYHTNFSAGQSLGKFGGATFRSSRFWYYPNKSEVYCLDTQKWYPLRAFIGNPG